MEQSEINDAEWQNPDNWSGGIHKAYFSKRDSRLFVPASRLGVLGFRTVNFGHPWGFAFHTTVYCLGVAAFYMIGRRSIQ